MCDSKCLYIIGFDIHDNDGLREFFVECLDKNFHIERINQSCYKCKSDIPLRDFKTSLSGIIKDCIKQCGSFHEEDFIKLYCTAIQADFNAKDKHQIYEYNIEIK